MSGEGDEVASPAALTDLRLEMHVGHVTLSCVDDYHCAGTPLLQLTLCLQRALLHKPDAASALLLSLQARASLCHYQRQLHGAPQGWEPILLPCVLDIGIDLDRRTATVGSRAAIDFDISSSLLRSLLGIQARLLSAQHGSSPATVPFAPFRLQNDTGIPLRYSFYGEAPCELPASTGAALAEAPSSQAGARALRVQFDGFQPLELRPPVPRPLQALAGRERRGQPGRHLRARAELPRARLRAPHAPLTFHARELLAPSSERARVHRGAAAVRARAQGRRAGGGAPVFPACLDRSQPAGGKPAIGQRGCGGRGAARAVSRDAAGAAQPRLDGAGWRPACRGGVCYTATATYASCGWLRSGCTRPWCFTTACSPRSSTSSPTRPRRRGSRWRCGSNPALPPLPRLRAPPLPSLPRRISPDPRFEPPAAAPHDARPARQRGLGRFLPAVPRGLLPARPLRRLPVVAARRRWRGDRGRRPAPHAPAALPADAAARCAVCADRRGARSRPASPDARAPQRRAGRRRDLRSHLGAQRVRARAQVPGGRARHHLDAAASRPVPARLLRRSRSAWTRR